MIEWREGTGPFVVVPVEAVPAWPGGAEGRRLCEEARLRRLSGDTAVLAPAGIVEMGAARQALALGDEHSPIAYLPRERLFARWLWAGDAGALDGLVDAALRSLPSLTWEKGPLFDAAGTLLMFDADLPGAEAPAAADTVALAPGPGRYRVDTCVVEPDDLTRIDLHRLVAAPPG